MRPLQKAAKLLGPPRDACVLLETLNELSHRFADALPQKSLELLKTTLLENCATAQAEFDRQEAAPRICRLLKKSRKRVGRIKLKRSWRSLELGLGKSFGSSHAAFETAYTEQSSENFHEWRKRVQDVRNQIELLDSRKETSLGEDLKYLSQTLGLDHDIFMLRHFFESHYSSKNQRAKIRPLDESLRPFEEKLRQSVLTRGTTFYYRKSLGLPAGSAATVLLP
jgi:CHAD domain-containing protein